MKELTDKLHGTATLLARRACMQRMRIAVTALSIAAACLCMLPPVIAAPGSWTQKADMPGQTSTPVGCAVDGILYIIGGHYQYTNQLRTVFAYDPRTDS